MSASKLSLKVLRARELTPNHYEVSTMSKREILLACAAVCLVLSNICAWTLFKFEYMAHQYDSSRDSVTIQKLSAHASHGLQLEIEHAKAARNNSMDP